MKTKTITLKYVLPGVVLLLSQLAAAHAHDFDDPLLASVGEFEVGNGESKSIAHHKDNAPYRICVRKARHSVPLKVLYDGREDVVSAGDCADFEAKNIRIEPAAKLETDMVLIGRYHYLKP